MSLYAYLHINICVFDVYKYNLKWIAVVYKLLQWVHNPKVHAVFLIL